MFKFEQINIVFLVNYVWSYKRKTSKVWLVLSSSLEGSAKLYCYAYSDETPLNENEFT